MSQSSGMDLFYWLLIIVLPLSALFAQRLAISSLLKMAAGWLAIFGILLISVGQKERFRPLWDSASLALNGADQVVTGGTVRISMADDGHFWANVRLNGVPRRMLIDSGASITALSQATAQAAGILPDIGAPVVTLSTANGDVRATRATLAHMQLGAIAANDMPIVIAAEFGENDVIGMNFLSRLHGWRVEGRMLILEPNQV